MAKYLTRQRKRLLAYLSEHTDEQMTARQIAAEECKDSLHLSCRVCGKSIHLGEKEAEQLLHSTFESTGFQIDKTETILYGICADCRK